MAHVRKFLRKLFGDKSANVMIITAAVMVPLIGAIGLGIDSTRAFIVKDRLQKSIDAAGLAAGRALTNDDRMADAEAYFALNFDLNENLGKKVAFDLQFDDANQTITINATAQTSASFMRIFGHDTLNIVATTVIQRELKGAEVVMVLDTTGSMSSSGKMTAMKIAAHDLLDIVFGGQETIDDFYMGIVPFIAAVSVGDQHTDWIKSNDRLFTKNGRWNSFRRSPWRGCVEARSGINDQNDKPPRTNGLSFHTYFYPYGRDNRWNPVDGSRMTGPNGGCPPAIAQLGSTKTALDAKIDELQPTPRGGTIIPQGLVWGWRVLSPEWQGYWGAPTPANLPLPYDEPRMEKVVVVLTDGANQIGAGCRSCGGEYTAYGRIRGFGFSSMTAGRHELNRRTSAICEAMKAEGIILYTITFGSSLSTEIKDLMEACATKPAFFFHAPDNATLKQVFKTIGGQLSNLRISK